jgi:hypothetical protein
MWNSALPTRLLIVDSETRSAKCLAPWPGMLSIYSFAVGTRQFNDRLAVIPRFPFAVPGLSVLPVLPDNTILDLVACCCVRHNISM